MSDLTRTMLGTRSRLLSAVGLVIALVVVVPIVLLVFGLVVAAAVSVLVGLLCLAAIVLALLPGRRRWR
ncbi:MAG TPA: hypothetical protein VL337_05890 [Acidimicrobiales bacterium]|nr:hypothetical protein [Acidimicrobiales bacterium]